jgi:hypothetical protein
VNHALLAILNPQQIEVEVWREDELARHRGLSSELDEMWSYVARKSNPRWLWHAIDHHTGKVLAYVFGRRKDQVFRLFAMIWAVSKSFHNRLISVFSGCIHFAIQRPAVESA